MRDIEVLNVIFYPWVNKVSDRLKPTSGRGKDNE